MKAEKKMVASKYSSDGKMIREVFSWVNELRQIRGCYCWVPGDQDIFQADSRNSRYP